jgi:hypothetical protein
VDAIEKLTASYWNRLHKAASSFLYGTVFSHVDELVNETLCRCLSGSRNWPSNVPFLIFFTNAMESVADGDRNLIYKTRQVLATDLLPITNNEMEFDPIENFGNDNLSPDIIITTEENRLVAEEEYKNIENYFKGNETVEWVLLGIEDEMSASEIIEMSGMTKTEYESARKSLLRGLDKLFPGRRIKK